MKGTNEVRMLSIALLTALSAAACSDPTGSGGEGNAVFTSWGEEFIEEQIPAGGDGGFVDGWTVKYSKFLVVIGGVSVADLGGKEAARMEGTRLVNHVNKGVKTLVTFTDLSAQAYERVGYEIVPATAQTEPVNADAADRDFMASNGYAVYVEGTATKDQVSKTFKWGFTQTTKYVECKAEQGGKEVEGIIVTNGGTDTSELTIHGDHFFYDRLQADPTGAIPTNLRFEAVARADDDGDKNGEVTLDELAKAPLDLKTGYDPSGLDASNMKEFITQLSRTVGHFRGEGECSFKN